VKSWGDELARFIDLRIHPAVPDLPGLDAILPEDRPNGIICTVEADQSQWQFLAASNAPASPTVRVPADDPTAGRWCLVGANLGQSLGGDSALAPTRLAATITTAQFASLAAGVKSTPIPIGAVAPAGARPLVRELTLTTPFGGGAATMVTLDLGGTVPNDIVAGQSLFTGAPAAMQGQSGVNPSGNHGGQQLQATITSDADLNTLNAGSVTVVLYVAAMP
jgi:hypothetical protein